jgi:hypothetical protein
VINHVRTLLANQSGDKRPGLDFYLEEYIDPAFKALELPAYLESIRGVLFGRGADNAWVNFRLRQYMTMLHATEFEQYVLDYDPRITYGEDRKIDESALRVEVSPVNVAAAGTLLYLLGRFSSSSAFPILKHTWDVSVLSGLVVENINLRTGHSVQETVMVVDNLSSPVPLADQKSASIAVAHSAPLPTGALWRLDVFVPPPDDLAEIPGRLEQLSGSALQQLFFGDSTLTLYRRLWEEHWFIQYRMAGLLLAVAARTEEVRRHV